MPNIGEKTNCYFRKHENVIMKKTSSRWMNGWVLEKPILRDYLEQFKNLKFELANANGSHQKLFFLAFGSINLLII